MSKPHMITTLFILITITTLIVVNLPTKTEALIPYNRPLWDTIVPFEDPFRILEHNPLDHLTKNMDTINLARADWKETSTHHVITLDVPGIKREEIKIEVEDNRVLKVSGERKEVAEGEGDKWHRAERTSGKFWRQFRLPGSADMDKISAHLEDGVLKVMVPKVAQEKRQPKVIDIMGKDGVGEDVKTTKSSAAA
ncbi:16.9 kDa class I heat shock protein 1-like [Rutidosis leptorrhynchoides]|uniref:16.9 kDa class I heat shock protein 1-like n=1 Tax=Rutidosis leptorrhynchoides TaxID=125765 RepID=UPI003A98F998